VFQLKKNSDGSWSKHVLHQFLGSDSPAAGVVFGANREERMKIKVQVIIEAEGGNPEIVQDVGHLDCLSSGGVIPVLA
jgi:hypothetical protein